MTFDSLYQAETYSKELRAGHRDALDAAVSAVEKVRDSDVSSVAYSRGAGLARQAILDLSQEGT